MFFLTLSLGQRYLTPLYGAYPLGIYLSFSSMKSYFSLINMPWELFSVFPKPSKVELSSSILCPKKQFQPDGDSAFGVAAGTLVLFCDLRSPRLTKKAGEGERKGLSSGVIPSAAPSPWILRQHVNSPGALLLETASIWLPRHLAFPVLPPVPSALIGSSTLSAGAQDSVLDPSPLYLHPRASECITSWVLGTPKFVQLACGLQWIRGSHIQLLTWHFLLDFQWAPHV